MRLKDFGFGAMVAAICLLIGVSASQLGRYTTATDVISDVKPSQSAPTVQEEETMSVIAPEQPGVLEQVLYIGELRGCGLRDDARIPGADYFCAPELTVFNLDGVQLSDLNFHDQALDALLADREYTCVLVCLGLNEAGYPLEQLNSAFSTLVEKLIRTQPQAQIVLQGLLTVGEKQAARSPYTAPENLRKINTLLQSVASTFRIGYLDTNAHFADSDGFLPESMSPDGCYLYPEQNRILSQWICRQVEEMER